MQLSACPIWSTLNDPLLSQFTWPDIYDGTSP